MASIPPKTSARICQHMNEDHELSLYAMAKSQVQLKSGYKIQQVSMKQISLVSCTLSVVTCSGDLCEPLTVEYPFNPPLKSDAEVRARLVDIHQSLMQPRLSWLVTKPSSLLYIPFLICTMWASRIATMKELKRIVESLAVLHPFDMSVDDKLRYFFVGLQVLFFFTMTAHVVFVCFVADKCKFLKLQPATAFAWVLYVGVAGLPFFMELFDMYKFQREVMLRKRKTK